MSTETDPTKRFSDRVHDYVRYRPGYPPEVLTILERKTGLTSASVIADIGSGTGISTDIFLRNGNTVFAVEPNEKMRASAESRFTAVTGFQSVNGTAEQTTLQDSSIDIVVAAQAFHWFDKSATRREFVRILKPAGSCVLLWNSRRTDTTDFLSEYERLLKRYSIDYERVNHKNVDPSDFFSPGKCHITKVFHAQALDYESLEGRLFSSSYIPPKENPASVPLITELREIFQQHQSGGTVSMEYDTEIYIGNLPPVQ